MSADLESIDQQLLELLRQRFETVAELTRSGKRSVTPDATEAVRVIQQLGLSEAAAQIALKDAARAAITAHPAADKPGHDEDSATEAEAVKGTKPPTPPESTVSEPLVIEKAAVADRLKGIFTDLIAHCRDSIAPLLIAYLGPEGTFTQAATFKYFGSSTHTQPYTAIDDVFRSVETGECHFGVVPVENSIEGTINRTLDLIAASPLGICGEDSLRIEHNLLTNAAGLSDISVVYAHPQALAQCRQWLNENLPNARREAASSNAAGAQLAVSDESVAAIASVNAADIYQLNILSRNIEDDPSNTTRFIVIGRQRAEPSGNDITTLVVSAPHRPGGLRRMLEPFETAGISMTRIESRPARGKLWNYQFFIDVAGHQDDEVLSTALQQLSAETQYIRVLGSYPTVRI